MRLTAKPVAAAHISTGMAATRTANPDVALLCNGRLARAIAKRQDDVVTIYASWAVSRGATSFPYSRGSIE